MSKITRRRFLVVGGAGAIVVAAGGAALAIRQFSTKPGSSGGTLTFQAVAALPRAPLASYASYVIAGQVHLGNGVGTMTRTIFAGAPNARQPIALLTRAARVTSVQSQGNIRHITGTITDPSQLQPGESASFTIVIDPDHKVAQSDFFGDPIQLQLEQVKETGQ
ncbi:MAG TPA: hypothetical protein VFU69_14590 [Ktedonobacterales bacterium]|nr:hypothetical protein [Ktedonobacterales bacterium]